MAVGQVGRPGAGGRHLTRRELIRELGAAGAGARLGVFGGVLTVGLGVAGCGAGVGAGPGSDPGDGSTRRSTWVDRDGTGVLRVGPGEPLAPRTELAPASPAGRVLATLAHVTDAHVLDAQSPARVPFLARLGPPFSSTFRPHETLTVQVLAGAVRAVAGLAPDAVIQGGDLIDNAQGNELEWALAVLAGGLVRAASGGPGYHGVQNAGNPDPLYYRPDLDAPRHPGLLAAALRPFAGPGLRPPWHPVLGDHDLLAAGVLPVSPLTDATAVGGRAVWELPADLPGHIGTLTSASSPDGFGAPGAIDRLVVRLLDAASVAVPADPRRGQLAPEQALAALRRASAGGGAGPRLDYSFDIGDAVRVVVLDLVRRGGGSGGIVAPEQPAWLAAELRGAGRRKVLVFSHQPLDTTAGGPGLLAELDRSPHVVAAIWGHTHRNRITPRPGLGGGYWLISTASLIDYPQQARALRLVETTRGVALETWMLDHVAATDGLGVISRELAYLDAHGGRPQGFAGAPGDRNAVLYRPGWI